MSRHTLSALLGRSGMSVPGIRSLICRPSGRRRQVFGLGSFPERLQQPPITLSPVLLATGGGGLGGASQRVHIRGLTLQGRRVVLEGPGGVRRKEQGGEVQPEWDRARIAFHGLAQRGDQRRVRALLSHRGRPPAIST
jgi:hypothetical protein